jgi:hypothetical protein
MRMAVHLEAQVPAVAMAKDWRCSAADRGGEPSIYDNILFRSRDARMSESILNDMRGVYVYK